MKTPKPDQLFKNKITNHKVSPPPGAWTAIEENLQKRKSVFSWRILKVAAIVLLLLSAAILFNPFTSEQSMPVANNDPSIEAKQQPTNIDQNNQPDVMINDPEPAKSETLAEAIPNQPGSLQPKLSSAQLVEINIEPVEIVKQNQDEIEKASALDTNSNDHKIVVEYIAATSAKKDTTQSATENYGPVVVEYIGDDDNMVADKKEKAIKKVIQFALELKNGEIGLAELREAKDDLLSIEKEKNKTQK